MKHTPLLATIKMKKLVTYCNNCNSKIKLKKSANDRVELQMKIGDNVSLKCSKCQMTHNYHINKVVATHTILPLTVLVSAFIIIPIIISFLRTSGFLKLDYILYNGGLISTVIVIPFLFFFTVNKSEDKDIRLFNQHKVMEK